MLIQSIAPERTRVEVPSVRPPRLLPQPRLLRLSVTDLCNFRCRYCMPAEGIAKNRHADLPRLETLADLVAWLIKHTGIAKVRLTGGEPLVRHGIDHLIARLSTLPTIQEVSLTTNGSLLAQMAWRLKTAGLNRVNVSLDSLDQERFSVITRGGNLERTLTGIKAARDAKLTPIKLNTVLQRSTWKRELPLLLDYAAENGFEIRFIELMRTGTERAWCDSEFISADEVRRELDPENLDVPIDDRGRAPALRTRVNWQGTPMIVGWITPQSHPFCDSCERMRMDARGRVRRCLMDPATFDLSEALKAGDVAALTGFQAYLAGKLPPLAMASTLAMSQLGG